MSDKKTAPWMLELQERAMAEWVDGSGTMEEFCEWLIKETVAVECMAPAPQPANYALALDVVDAIEWIDQNEPKRARDVLAEVRDKLRAATPQVTPTEGPLCDNCGKPSREHWCWIGLPKDENENYAPSERRGTGDSQ